MRCPCNGFVRILRQGRPLWGAGKTRIFIESERFTWTGASFLRDPAWWPPSSDFTVTLHLQCNSTDGGITLVPNSPLPHAKA